MKVEVFTLCWNEMDVLQWVIDYWRQYASHVTVFDNGSTDGSDWFLGRFDDWITIKPFETDGLNDTVHQNIKNNCWKGCDADFVVVCDMDECLLAKDIMASLKRMKEEGATICKPKWYDLMAAERPEYKEGEFLHETSPMARPLQGSPKAILFDPKAITSINYNPGAHHCSPEGRVKWYEGGDIYCLHINHNLSLSYRLAKYEELNKRRSAENRRNRHGIHYSFSESILTAAWNEDMKHAVNLNEILKKHG